MDFEAQDGGAWESWQALVEEGHCARLNGLYPEAEASYKMALGLTLKSKLFVRPPTAETLSVLGDLYADQNKYAQAEKMYRLALIIYQQLDSSHSINSSIALKRISEMCRLQEKIPEALECNKRAEVATTSVRAQLDRVFNQG